MKILNCFELKAEENLWWSDI